MQRLRAIFTEIGEGALPTRPALLVYFRRRRVSFLKSYAEVSKRFSARIMANRGVCKPMSCMDCVSRKCIPSISLK